LNIAKAESARATAEIDAVGMLLLGDAPLGNRHPSRGRPTGSGPTNALLARNPLDCSIAIAAFWPAGDRNGIVGNFETGLSARPD